MSALNQKSAFFPLDIRYQRAVLDPHSISNSHTGRGRIRNRLSAAVFEPDNDFEMLRLSNPFFDLISGKRASDGTGDLGCCRASAGANLATEQATSYAAHDRPQITAFAFDLDRVDRFDDAAIGAQSRRPSRPWRSPRARNQGLA